MLGINTINYPFSPSIFFFLALQNWVTLSSAFSWHKVQVARSVTRAPRSRHVSPLLQELRWLPAAFWLQFKVLAMNSKA